jgi:ABC-type polysaccharide/polyol phosphate export permease
MLAEGLIKQMSMPLTIHVLRMVWRNLIVFFHHFLIVIVVLAFFPPPPSAALLSVPLAIFAIAINAVWLSFILGTLCARFRDIPPIVQSVVQVLFFLTPVLWRPEVLGRHEWAAHVNPLHHMLEIVRAPLLGKGFPLESWLVVGLVTVVGFAVGLVLFARYRPRIAYWV